MGALPAYDAIILAGGSGRRLGGVDKPALEVGGRRLLDRVLESCAGADRTIVAGPRRPTARAVTWCREEPPGGGPVAALAAALPLTHAEVVVVLAADLPLLGATVPRLVAALGGDDDGALLVDGEGRQQFLSGAYRRDSLVATLGDVPDPAGASMRRLLAGLRLRTVRDEDGAGFDVDTAADVVRAEVLLREVEGGARGVDDDGGA